MGGSNKELEVYADGLDPLHRSIIDEYFANGFNKSRAAMTYRQGITPQAGISLTNAVLKKKENQPYIKQKQEDLRATTNITSAVTLKELINMAFADASMFIGLKAEEIKNLPPDVRRSITSVSIKTKKYKDRQGKEIEEETVSIKTVDKLQAIDMINKHIGFYAEDNAQRNKTIDITKLNQTDQNNLIKILQALDKSEI